MCTVRTWPQGTLLSRDSCLTHATYSIYLRTARLTSSTHLRGRMSKTSCQDALSEGISIDLSSTALFSLPVPLVLLHFHYSFKLFEFMSACFYNTCCNAQMQHSPQVFFRTKSFQPPVSASMNGDDWAAIKAEREVQRGTVDVCSEAHLGSAPGRQ